MVLRALAGDGDGAVALLLPFDLGRGERSPTLQAVVGLEVGDLHIVEVAEKLLLELLDSGLALGERAIHPGPGHEVGGHAFGRLAEVRKLLLDVGVEAPGGINQVAVLGLVRGGVELVELRLDVLEVGPQVAGLFARQVAAIRLVLRLHPLPLAPGFRFLLFLLFPLAEDAAKDADDSPDPRSDRSTGSAEERQRRADLEATHGTIERAADRRSALIAVRERPDQAPEPEHCLLAAGKLTPSVRIARRPRIELAARIAFRRLRPNDFLKALLDAFRHHPLIGDDRGSAPAATSTGKLDMPVLIRERKREAVLAGVRMDPLTGRDIAIAEIGGHAFVVLRVTRRRDPFAGRLHRSVFLQRRVEEFGLTGNRAKARIDRQGRTHRARRCLHHVCQRRRELRVEARDMRLVLPRAQKR